MHSPINGLTFCIHTFGCQMNKHDSERIAGMLEALGALMVETVEESDVVVFMTCCVREAADTRLYGQVASMKNIPLRAESPLSKRVIAVGGCIGQRDGGKLTEALPHLDVVFGTHNLGSLPRLLEAAIEGQGKQVEVLAASSEFPTELPTSREHSWAAWLPITIGCNNFCSYCIVPYVRGRERSRRADDIVREADELVKSGVKEIMLIGQNVNSYGLDSDEGVSFAQLLHRVSQTGIERIRFMTSHPKDLSDALIDEMAHNPAVAPHLHLPVQAGSNRILQAMNRRYTREQYLEKVQKLRAAIPHIGLTTDLIVAFPGETEAEFEDTLSLVEQVRYDSAYTFIYSPRKGTRAAEMPGRIAPDVASARIERLIALQEKITGEVLASMRGEIVQALVEGVSRRRENQLTGKTGRNINVNFNGAPDDIGKMVRVRITGAGSNTLRGEKVEE